MMNENNSDIVEITNDNKELLKQLAMSVGLFDTTRNKLINITIKPSKILKSQFDVIKNLQPKLNLLYYNLSKDLEKYQFDEPMYQYLYEIYLEKKKCKKEDIKAFYVRSDYLLNDNVYKQVEINTISQCFVSLGPALNRIHSLLYKNVEVSEADKKFLKFLAKIKNVYETKNNVKNTVIAMVDKTTDEKSSNYLEKVQLILEFMKLGITMRYVTIEELTMKENCSKVFYNTERVSIVYYRWYYNIDHYDEFTKNMRKKLELSNVVSLPSVEFQMINSKLFQVVLSERLSLYTSDYEEISKAFGEFISNKQKFEQNKLSKDFKPEEWLEKSINEGGNSININSESSIYMKRFKSSTVKNMFIDDEIERDVINEVSIFGCLLIVDDTITINEEAGYIVRTKDKSKLEGGICSGNGGLDSITFI